jgi:hypothetical protein
MKKHHFFIVILFLFIVSFFTDFVTVNNAMATPPKNDCYYPQTGNPYCTSGPYDICSTHTVGKCYAYNY